MVEQDLITHAEERLVDWGRRATLWYYIYYILGAVAVILTITVASRPEFVSSGLLSILAWMAAIFQGLSTFLVALPKATAYRAAWRMLWSARLDYIDSQKSEDDAKLLRDSIRNGWAIIDGGYTAVFQTQGSPELISGRASLRRRVVRKP